MQITSRREIISCVSCSQAEKCLRANVDRLREAAAEVEKKLKELAERDA